MRYILITLALLAGGCVEAGARVAADGAFIHEAGSNLLRKRINQRVFIRDQCWTRMLQRVEDADRAGNFALGDKILAANMPSLLTTTALRNALEDGIQGDVINELNRAPGCEPVDTTTPVAVE